MRLELGKSKRVALDMLINLAGTGLGLAVLQLIIYPIVSNQMDSDSYGQMLSIMSTVYIVSGTLGLALSTTRLVRRVRYEEQNIEGDYALLSLICLAAAAVVLPPILVFYFKTVDVIDVLLILLIGLFNFTSSYYIVGFRIRINYKAIFIDKVFCCIGYAIGYGLFCLFHRWEFIFIMAFLLESVYCAVMTKLVREPIRKTALFSETGKTFVNLGIASLLSRLLTYFDKLLLYPLLGGTAVSVYFAANIFGKLIMMTIEPITNVVLSYLSKHKTVSKSLWKTVVPAAAAGCALMYFVCLLISKPVITWFYPQWAEEAIGLVPLTTLCLALSSFISIMWPFTLKALESYKQIILNSVGIAVYIIAALLLYQSSGIRGCCIALLLSHVAKLVVMAALCVKTLGRDDAPEETA